jgi:N-acetylglucosaminyldiphosphoundecaprenol N-acetyl-beta-D-mannosaminyltransferase
MSPPSHSRIQIGGVPIDAVTFDEALAIIVERVSRKLGGAVFTPNVDHIVIAQKDHAFRDVYSRVALSLVDGTPVLWASHLLGHPLPEKISGADLFLPLVQLARNRGFRVFLLGGAPGTVEIAAARLLEQFPGVQIAGTASPEVGCGPASTLPPGIVEQLRAAAPDLLFVALGAPKQEFFIDQIQPLIGPCVAVAVGAALDFAAGRLQRAPVWVSKAGLEWAYRLWREPLRLWRRYLLRDPVFFAILAKEVCRRRRERSAR